MLVDRVQGHIYYKNYRKAKDNSLHEKDFRKEAKEIVEELLKENIFEIKQALK